jgi:cobalt-zinc-cadmium efflux system outer membrane protein
MTASKRVDRRQGQIAEWAAAISQTNAVLDQRRLELISATERAFDQYQLADQQATALQSGELRATESAVDDAKAAYRFGERGIVEVLYAQRVLQSCGVTWWMHNTTPIRID